MVHDTGNGNNEKKSDPPRDTAQWLQHPVISVITWLLGRQIEDNLPPADPKLPPNRWSSINEFNGNPALIKFNMESSDDKLAFDEKMIEQEDIELRDNMSPQNGHWGFYVAITPDTELYMKKASSSATTKTN